MKQNIKLGIRRLFKFKAYSIINIIGLGIAVSVCLIILSFVAYHFSFDKFIEDNENSYRIITRYGDGTYNANTFACFDKVLTNCLEVTSHTTCYNIHNVDEVFVDDKKIKIDELSFVNESFIEFFNTKMLEGEKESINKPNTMFVTPKMANILFPNNSAIGQTVFLRSFTANQDSLIGFTVTGVVQPLPETSHIGYDILLSQKGHFNNTVESLKDRKVFGAAVYVKLFQNIDILAFEKKITDKVGPILDGVQGPPVTAFNHHLQPVRDIHFSTDTQREPRPTIRRSSLNILLIVGLLILAIATINFVSIYKARSVFHQKESEIIRFLGGSKLHIFNQVFVEVFCSITIGFILAIALVELFQMSLATYFFKDWNVSLHDQNFWIITLALFLLITAIVSIFSFLNQKRARKEAFSIRQFNRAIPLVIFQFVMVIALISFTLLINKQMKFINEKSLGYTSENVLVIKLPQRNAKMNVFREELLKIPGITSAATTHNYPGYSFQDQNFSSQLNTFSFKFGFIDPHVIKTLAIKPIKYFTDAKEKAVEGWLINESFYNQLRTTYTDEQIRTGDFPSDETLPEDNSRSNFVALGVISDFHYASLHEKIECFAFYVRDPEKTFNRFMLARFNQSKSKEVLKAIENKMSEIYPGQLIRYDFLDEQLQAQYNSEQTLMKLIDAFSVLAIFISCLGLIGLSIFTTEKRTKEIGVRKVNGAKTMEVMQLLNNTYIKLVCIAFILACPLAYFAMHKWLLNFAYKISLSWWIFAFAGLLTLIIAIITVSWQTFKAARRNPVEALRYE